MARGFSIAGATFVIALTLRLANAPLVFADGVPRIAPIDELYHWKRITWSATHFPQVLELDPDRGERGAFCPWPPLYDLAAAAAARLLGAQTPLDVLLRIIWIPPLIGAACAGLAAAWIARHFGALAAISAGLALAASPFIVTQSSIGSIDHHFLEWPLTFAILGSICAILRGRAALGSLLLAMAMIAAMFVQTALLIASALAFVVLFALTDGASAAIAFSATAMAIALYRLTRLDGYPDNAWFLGWTHAALFAGASVACAYLYFRRDRIFALLCGMAVVLAVPTAPGAILDGAHFLRGEQWLQTIVEFQPMWKGSAGDTVSQLAGLSAGAILVWILAAQAGRRRDAVRGTIALFAIIYLLLTISSRRFWSDGIPLLALAGAVSVASMVNRRRAVLAAAAVALIPTVQLALWMRHPDPPIKPQQAPWIRTASFLQRQPRPGRVLAPWSLGHVIDVVGERAVIVDNFGTMPDPIAFGRADDAFLVRDETALARYCQESGVRYIVLDNPLYGLQGAAAELGIDRTMFVVSDSEGRPARITKLAQATWWWRAYFARGAAIPQQGIFGRPFTEFRLIYADPQPSWRGTEMYRGPALMVWEYIGRVR
jgi:asparagine N-glycosylation enzyme membrane subunit Stt3